MSRPTPALDGPAAQARAQLPEEARTGFDRLVHGVLASRSAALGAVLRSQLPGTAGVRWLHGEGISPTAKPSVLTAENWLSLHTAWVSHEQAPRSGSRSNGHGPRADSRHGHAPGAQAAPRWF